MLDRQRAGRKWIWTSGNLNIRRQPKLQSNFIVLAPSYAHPAFKQAQHPTAKELHCPCAWPHFHPEMRCELAATRDCVRIGSTQGVRSKFQDVQPSLPSLWYHISRCFRILHNAGALFFEDSRNHFGSCSGSFARSFSSLFCWVITQKERHKR